MNLKQYERTIKKAREANKPGRREILFSSYKSHKTLKCYWNFLFLKQQHSSASFIRVASQKEKFSKRAAFWTYLSMRVTKVLQLRIYSSELRPGSKLVLIF